MTCAAGAVQIVRPMSRVGGFALLAWVSVSSPSCKKSEATAAANGHDLFVATCARCHGAAGAGGLPLWEGGPSPRDLRDHELHAQRTDAQLFEVIKKGKGAGMPPFGGALSDDRIAAIVAHVRSLDRREGR